jgi:regulatory protein
MDPDRPACRHKALDLLARREHARLELERKLAKRGHDGDLIRDVLDELEREGLLAEQRFVDSFVRSRIARGQGPVRIRLELGQRGVESVDAALLAAECDWTGLARDVRRKRFGADLPASYAERARQARFLQYRGFTPEQIQDALEFADASD